MEWMIQSLLASAPVIAVAGIRALGYRKIPKNGILLLWGLAVCRLLVPWRIDWAVLSADAPLASMTVYGSSATATVQNAVQETAKAPATVSWWTVLWFIGMAAVVLYFVFGYARSLARFRTAARVNHAFLYEWRKSHPCRRRLEIKESQFVQSPLTYGVFRPVILMPKGMDWTDEKLCGYLLEHEYVHVRRLDALWKLILAGLLCVHWFNPLVWMLFVLANRDMETACDELVLRQFGERAKREYAWTLVHWEERKRRATMLYSHFGRNGLQNRIVSIMKYQQMSKRSWIGAGVLVLAVAALSICTMLHPVVKAEEMNVGELVEVRSGQFIAQADVDKQSKATYTIPVYAEAGETQLGWYQHYVNDETGAAVDNIYAWEEETASMDLTDAKSQVERMNANELAVMEVVGDHGEKGYAKQSDMESVLPDSEIGEVTYYTIPVYGEDRKTMIDVLTRAVITVETDGGMIAGTYYANEMTEEQIRADAEKCKEEMRPLLNELKKRVAE